MGVDPVEEVGDFGEDARCSLASASSPGDDSDDVELSRLGLGWADERSTGVAHAGGIAVGSEPDHARLDHFWPTGLQVGILPDLALKLLEGVRLSSWGIDETPSLKKMGKRQGGYGCRLDTASCVEVESYRFLKLN